MSTGRSPPSTLDQASTAPDSKRRKIEEDLDVKGSAVNSQPVLVNGLDSSLIARLPRTALLEIILQTLPTSTAVKAIVLEKLCSERLLTDKEIDEEESAEELDDDATDLESLSGEEAESSQQSLGVDETGPLAGLSVLAKLIMEIMNSAPAPEGGMPWREFEGIWPDLMGSVEDAIAECMERGMLVAVNGNPEFVISTMPMIETTLA